MLNPLYFEKDEGWTRAIHPSSFILQRCPLLPFPISLFLLIRRWLLLED